MAERLGRLIRRRRHEQNMSITTFSEAVGLTQAGGSAWENGGNTAGTRLSNVALIARVFGDDVEKVLQELRVIKPGSGFDLKAAIWALDDLDDAGKQLMCDLYDALPKVEATD
jgi:transcriptional regulator with XRE-family HTH domain